jgi:hypothetical protein
LDCRRRSWLFLVQGTELTTRQVLATAT